MIEKAQFSKQLLHPKYWLLWFGVGLARLTQLLPLDKQMKIGVMIGYLVKKLIIRRMHIAKRNLELCFPDMPQAEQVQLLERNIGSPMVNTVSSVGRRTGMEKSLRRYLGEGHRRQIGIEHV